MFFKRTLRQFFQRQFVSYRRITNKFIVIFSFYLAIVLSPLNMRYFFFTKLVKSRKSGSCFNKHDGLSDRAMNHSAKDK